MPKPFLIGDRFGKLVIIALPPRGPTDSNSKAVCRCDCGNETVVFRCNLSRPNTTSCGCVRYQVVAQKNTKHGMTKSPEHRSYTMMKNRCLNPKTDRFKYYGARGITVCERWRDSFEAFLVDMGPRPAGTTLERIDNNGNYEPGNCKWATRSEQSRNRRPRGTALIGQASSPPQPSA